MSFATISRPTGTRSVSSSLHYDKATNHTQRFQDLDKQMKEKLLSTLLLDNPEIFSIIEDKITGLITSVKVKEHRQRTRAAFDAQQNSTLVQQLKDHNTNNNDAVYGYDARRIQRIHDNHTVEPPTSSVDPGYALYADDDHGGGGNSGLRIAEELTIAVAPVDRSILIELNTNNAVVHPMLYTKVPDD